jgi:isopenicillin-N N-acyltransferase-like protein
MLPIVKLEGSPRAQGLAHGEQLKQRIQHNIEIYFERFQSEGKVTEDDVLNRAQLYWDAIQKQNPAYAENLIGVSEGSGFEILRLAAINVRYEILYHQFTENALIDGCTSYAISADSSENGNLIMGENWDWIPQVEGAVLHIKEGDLEILSFTEAGIVGGKIGLSSNGLGLSVNGLMSTDDDWSRLEKPFHVRCYEILRSKDLAEALRVIGNGTRSCSANYMIAQDVAGPVSVESAPGSVRELRPENGYVSHTNHFVDPSKLNITEPPSEKRQHSQHRLQQTHQYLSKNSINGMEKIKEMLIDHDGHPYSICRHIDTSEPPSEHYQTVTSAIMDLHERAMWISDGPPCENPYQEFRL